MHDCMGFDGFVCMFCTCSYMCMCFHKIYALLTINVWCKMCMEGFSPIPYIHAVAENWCSDCLNNELFATINHPHVIFCTLVSLRSTSTCKVFAQYKFSNIYSFRKLLSVDNISIVLTSILFFVCCRIWSSSAKVEKDFSIQRHSHCAIWNPNQGQRR